MYLPRALDHYGLGAGDTVWPPAIFNGKQKENRTKWPFSCSIPHLIITYAAVPGNFKC